MLQVGELVREKQPGTRFLAALLACPETGNVSAFGVTATNTAAPGSTAGPVDGSTLIWHGHPDTGPAGPFTPP
jgi:hypothetical protein